MKTDTNAKLNLLFSNQELRKLIVPLILEQALGLTVGLADTMMVSIAGEAAISAVSLVDMINVLILNVFAALSTGGAVVTSQYIGAGKRDEAGNSAKQLILGALGLSLGITATVLLTRQPLLTLFFGKIEANVMQNALIYLTITALSFPFLALYNSCAALFRSMQNSRITFTVSLLINAINIAGNAICLMGLHMGVAGAAIPTLISRIVGAVILYLLLRKSGGYLDITGKYHFRPALLKKILQIGIPSGIENGIFQFGRILVVSIVSGFGTAQIAANGVANTLGAMGYIIPSAIGLAMIAVIGQCAGIGDTAQVRHYAKKLMAAAYLGETATNILLLIGLNWILKLYNLSAEAKGLVVILLLIHNGIGTFLWPASFTLPNVLRACNDAKFTMIVSVCSMIVLRIGFSYILGIHFQMGIIGVWSAMVLDWICRISFFLPRYLRGRWVSHAKII